MNEETDENGGDEANDWHREKPDGCVQGIKALDFLEKQVAKLFDGVKGAPD